MKRRQSLRRVSDVVNLVLVGTLLLANLAGAQGQGTLRLPPYERVELPNGLVLLLMEHHEIPIVSLSLIVKTGSASDPPGREGVAALVGDLLGKGTPTRSSERISRDLDFIGARIRVSTGVDFTSIDAEFLARDSETGLEILADMVRNAVFPPEEVVKLVGQRQDELRSTRDLANQVIGRYFDAYLFGEHPYGRPVAGDERSLRSVSRNDLETFYANHYLPGNTVIAVVGDFTIAEMGGRLVEHFGSWPEGEMGTVSFDEPVRSTGRRVLLVDKPDSTQTYFYIGSLGVNRTHPDRIAISLVNTLFGGRFTSRLNTVLRVESGLTYGASSRFEMLKRSGPFVISSYTQNERTDDAIDVALGLLESLHEEGVSQEELASVKTYVKGQFPTRIETSDRLASTIAQLEFYGLDTTDVDDYFGKVDAVSLDDAHRVIREFFPFDDLVFVLVGRASEIDGFVRKYGSEVDRKSINDPGFWP